MNIFLSANLILSGLILLLVAEVLEQPRYIFANISGLGTSRMHEPYNRNNYYYCNVSVLFRDFCYQPQNQTMKIAVCSHHWPFIIPFSSLLFHVIQCSSVKSCCFIHSSVHFYPLLQFMFPCKPVQLKHLISSFLHNCIV